GHDHHGGRLDADEVNAVRQRTAIRPAPEAPAERPAGESAPVAQDGDEVVQPIAEARTVFEGQVDGRHQDLLLYRPVAQVRDGTRVCLRPGLERNLLDCSGLQALFA